MLTTTGTSTAREVDALQTVVEQLGELHTVVKGGEGKAAGKRKEKRNRERRLTTNIALSTLR
eukprot:9843005-Prorocentrum_lima.AAC.1